MGGRLDATNVIEKPLVTVITRIGLDHTEYLGNTKAEIAGEKAGIIKKGVPVVFWEQEEEVNEVIVKKAREMSAEVIPVSEKQVVLFKFKNKSVDFSMRSGYYEYIRASLSTRAVYQKENAALAVCALEVLSRSCPVTRQQVENGLSQAKWEGRMEEVLPGVFIDGAHNEDVCRLSWKASGRTAAVGKGICCFPLWRTNGWSRWHSVLWTAGFLRMWPLQGWTAREA